MRAEQARSLTLWGPTSMRTLRLRQRSAITRIGRREHKAMHLGDDGHAQMIMKDMRAVGRRDRKDRIWVALVVLQVQPDGAKGRRGRLGSGLRRTMTRPWLTSVRQRGQRHLRQIQAISGRWGHGFVHARTEWDPILALARDALRISGSRIAR